VVAEFALLWTVSLGVWVAALSAWSGVDAAVGAGLAVPCAAAATIARRLIGNLDLRQGRWVLLRSVLPNSYVVDLDGGSHAVRHHWRRGWE
jgi:hypothetical protein